MKITPARVLLALTPLLLAIAVVLALPALRAPLPVLIFRVDLRNVVLILCGLASLVWLGAVLRDLWMEERQRQALEDALLESEQARRRFLRRLDHEVKNPLTAMRAALANLTETGSASDPPRPVHDIQLQVERLSQLVGDLRKLAELEERPLERLPVDLNELLAEVVEMALSQPAYAGRELHLVVSKVPWPLPPVTGDRDLLWLVFYNLVDNALKYSGKQHTVEVRAQEDGRAVTVEVADNGPGIPPADLERIFEELYRGVNARGIEGSGLGLALTQRIVQRHGGNIHVRSRVGKGEESGVVFTVWLPL
jgi:signal transduction histidine kinase